MISPILLSMEANPAKQPRDLHDLSKILPIESEPDAFRNAWRAIPILRARPLLMLTSGGPSADLAAQFSGEGRWPSVAADQGRRALPVKPPSFLETEIGGDTRRERR